MQRRVGFLGYEEIVRWGVGSVQGLSVGVKLKPKV
jgi:hypothetical protein